MRISAFCSFCHSSVEALVVSVEYYGKEVEVTSECSGKSYMRNTPHILIQRMNLSTFQNLRYKNGEEGELP